MTDALAEVVDLDLDNLTPAERAARARDAWRASGGGLSADQLAERFDRSPRWARTQIAAARTEDEAAAPVAATAAAPLPPAPPELPPAETGSHDTPAGGHPLPQWQEVAAARLPAAFRVVTLGSVAAVAAVCAAASYTHLHDLVAAAGGGWLSWVLPLGIDGMVTAGSVTLIAHHRYGGPQRSRVLAVVAVTLGLVASVAANVAAVDPELVDLRHVRWALAAYPPVALALVVDLAFAMLRTEGQP